MRISDRYIGWQVLSGTFFAVLVLGLVLVLGNLFKQIQPLLVEQKTPLVLVLRFVAGVLPMSLIYTVPWGFLSAVLLVFGRLSSNQEITAFRVAGMSLARLSAPVFVIGALLSLASLYLNTHVVPVSKATVAQLLYEQASSNPDSLLKPGVVQGNFRGNGDSSVKVLIEGKRGEWVEGFHLYKSSDEPGGASVYVHARRAALKVDRVKSQLRIKLEDACFVSRKPGEAVEMAFAGFAEPLLIDLKDPRLRKTKAKTMTNDEILREVARNADFPEAVKARMRSEITKRYSFSMACLAFAFVAVPLGIGTRRRETSAGLVMSLVVGVAYFLITMLAERFETDAGMATMLWAPNVACVFLGIWLFRRARFR